MLFLSQLSPVALVTDQNQSIPAVPAAGLTQAPCPGEGNAASAFRHQCSHQHSSFKYAALTIAFILTFSESWQSQIPVINNYATIFVTALGFLEDLQILIAAAELQVDLAGFCLPNWLLSCFPLKSRQSWLKRELRLFPLWLTDSWKCAVFGLWMAPCRPWTWGWVAVPHLTGLRGWSIVKGGSSLFSFTTLTLRVSFQFAAGFPVFPRLFSLGKYSCLPAPACLVCSVVLLPAVLSCIFLAKYLGHALKGKLLERQLLGMKQELVEGRNGTEWQWCVQGAVGHINVRKQHCSWAGLRQTHCKCRGKIFLKACKNYS